MAKSIKGRLEKECAVCGRKNELPPSTEAGGIPFNIQELKKQIKSDEEVLDTGFVINFIKESAKKIADEAEDLGGVQVLNVEV